MSWFRHKKEKTEGDIHSRQLSVPSKVESIEISSFRRVIPTSAADMESIERIRKQLVNTGAIPSDAGISITEEDKNRTLEELAKLFREAGDKAITEKDFNAEEYDEQLYENLSAEDRELDNEFADAPYLSNEEKHVRVTLDSGEVIDAVVDDDMLEYLLKARDLSTEDLV